MRQGLLLSNQGMQAYSCHRGRLTFEGEFAETESGFESFRSYLDSHRAVPFRLLIDLPDESFRLESIPPARGADRRAIIERRLVQVANATPYTCAVSLGKQDGGRKNEILMLATLTRPAHIAPWLDLCSEAGTLIQQITSAPFLLSQIAKDLGLHHGRHLLFTLGAGGLRQTYFDEGRLQFSRLTADRLPQGDTATSCFEEAHKVRHYLGGGPLKPAAEAQFHILLAPQQIPAFEARCMAEGEVAMHVVDLFHLEADHGIPTGQPEDSCCDALLLQLMAKGVSTAQFAPAPILRPYRLWQWRRTLNISGGVILVSGLICAMVYGIQAWQLASEAQTQESLNRESRQQYQARLQTLPPMPAQADEIRGVSANMRALQRQSRFPDVTYRLLSYALDQVPEVELDRIEWRLAASTPQDRLPSEAHDGNSPADRRSRTVAIATMDLRVTEAGTDGTQAAAAVETLAATLRRYPDTEVEVIPTSAAGAATPSPPSDQRFSLRLVHGGH